MPFMPKERQKLRLLLLQIRDDSRVREEERDSFSSYMEVGKSQIDVLNVFDTPSFAVVLLMVMTPCW